MNIELLNSQLKELNKKFFNIERGGCGAFALMLSERLEKLGYATKLVLISSEGGCVKAKQKYLNSNVDCKHIEELNRRGIRLDHIMVYCNGYLIDNLEVQKRFKFTYLGDWGCSISGFIPKQVVKKWVENPIGWNSMFDRGQIPDIEREIETLVV